MGDSAGMFDADDGSYEKEQIIPNKDNYFLLRSLYYRISFFAFSFKKKAKLELHISLGDLHIHYFCNDICCMYDSKCIKYIE